jgi:hypothetical protein
MIARLMLLAPLALAACGGFQTDTDVTQAYVCTPQTTPYHATTGDALQRCGPQAVSPSGYAR